MAHPGAAIRSLQTRLIVPIVLLGQLAAAQVFAFTTDPLVGVRIGLLTNQEVLAAPPLPGLEDNEHGALSGQGGYLFSAIQTQTQFGAGVNQDTHGYFRGYTGGLGYTTPAKGHFGFFGFATYSRSNGFLDLTLEAPLQGGSSLIHMTNYAFSFAGGVSWRIGGGQNSPLSFGVFAGPTYTYLRSEFDLTAPGIDYHYGSNPELYGVMGGVQLGLRIGKLFLNPYLLRYQMLSPECQAYTTDLASDTGDPSGNCAGQRVQLVATFTGYGINVGWSHFYITAYSNVIKDSSVADISVGVYQLSYSLDL